MNKVNWDHYSDLPAPSAYQEQPYITLTHAEWIRIHNALCHAESMYQSVFDVLKNGPDMRRALDEIRMSLAPAYEQDSEQFNRQFDLYRHVQDTHGFASIWSMYDVTDFDAPHPYPSDVILQYRSHWGTEKQQERQYPVMGATWLDLWRASDLAIRDSGDQHHMFIERFMMDATDTTVVYLITGS